MADQNSLRGNFEIEVETLVTWLPRCSAAESFYSELQKTTRKLLSPIKNTAKMVRELNMNTQRQNFWKESIHKEATIRLLWHMKFSKEFARNHNIQEHYRKKQGELDIMKIVPVSHINLERYPKMKKARSLPVPGKETEGGESTRGHGLSTEMRPVSSSTRELLFKGFSALGEGRYQYLQKRKQKKPEDKYEFPVTSGWEYGWKVTKSMKNASIRTENFGRTKIVKDSFYRTNGVLPIENNLS